MLEEYNYDSCLPVRSKAKAGGRRRNPTNWSYTGVSLPTYTNRGFTGHEHLDMFSLIHMLSEAKSREQSEAGNGRIYDPEISRFLSPDPVIQDPYSMLNYNRYTYCLNNPLKYTDPSGYVKAEVEPGMIWTNPGWLKYADPTHLNNYFDYLESLGGGSGNIVEVYWDEDTKSYRDKKDGKPLSQDEFLTYLKWVISGATNGGDGPNLTNEFNQRVSHMEAFFGAIGKIYNDMYGGSILSYPQKFLAFGYIQYKGAGTEFMNPKAFSNSPFTINNGGYVNGEYFAPDDFGNYFYGVAAKAMGITLLDAVQGAGIYAIFSGSETDWSNRYGFFDERKDTQMIIRGYYGQ